MYEVINNLGPNDRFWIVILFGLLIASLECVAQVNLKYYSASSTFNIHLILGMLFYLLVSFTLLNSYRYEGMGHMNLVWSCMSIIFAFSVGTVIFGENMNKYTILAISLALLAIYCAHLQDEV